MDETTRKGWLTTAWGCFAVGGAIVACGTVMTAVGGAAVDGEPTGRADGPAGAAGAAETRAESRPEGRETDPNGDAAEAAVYLAYAECAERSAEFERRPYDGRPSRSRAVARFYGCIQNGRSGTADGGSRRRLDAGLEAGIARILAAGETEMALWIDEGWSWGRPRATNAKQVSRRNFEAIEEMMRGLAETRAGP